MPQLHVCSLCLASLKTQSKSRKRSIANCKEKDNSCAHVQSTHLMRQNCQIQASARVVDARRCKRFVCVFCSSRHHPDCSFRFGKKILRGSRSKQCESARSVLLWVNIKNRIPHNNLLLHFPRVSIVMLLAKTKSDETT